MYNVHINMYLQTKFFISATTDGRDLRTLNNLNFPSNTVFANCQFKTCCCQLLGQKIISHVKAIQSILVFLQLNFSLLFKKLTKINHE